MAIYWRNGWAWGRKTIKGEEIRAPLGTRSKREAEAAYNQWVATIQEAPAWVKRETPFTVAVNTFTEHHLGTLKTSSRVRYLQSLLNLTPHFDGKTLQGISRGDLTAYVAERRKAGVADPTIIRDLACLSSVYTIAADWELADANPVLPFLRAQKRRKALQNSEARTRYLSHGEELKLLAYAASLARAEGAIRSHEKWMIAAAFVAYIDTGMRAQELLAARWTWVDLARLEITVPKEFAKSAKERTIPILPRLARLLTTMERNKHSDLVFWRTRQGRGFDDLNHTLQRYGAAVGVNDITVHDLRRTCGCRLLQDHRVEMTIVSKWLGHASVVTTERIYAFLKVENLHEAVGTRREAEDLRPALDAVLVAPTLQNGLKNAQKTAHGILSH